MKSVKVQAPAKINITLDITGRREDGYHNIKSIMHTINLYDYLTIKIEDNDGIEIELQGSSDEIPYDNKNLVWKAAEKFFHTANICQAKLSVYIEKNIPVAAGLAGGSTDAAAVLFGLNELYEKILSDEQIHALCASLGSDLNFCLKGGCAICTSRGEKVLSLPHLSKPVSIVKPRELKISAKEAFNEYDKQEKGDNSQNSTDLLIPYILRGELDESLMENNLEEPLCNKYSQIVKIKKHTNGKMTGSGPTFFSFRKNFLVFLDTDEFIVHENLKTIGKGVEIVERSF